MLTFWWVCFVLICFQTGKKAGIYGTKLFGTRKEGERGWVGELRVLNVVEK